MTAEDTTRRVAPGRPVGPGERAVPDDAGVARERIAAGHLGRTAKSGVLWTMAGQWAGLLLTTATTIVLARLLTPTDFGLVGMALTLTVFVDQFRSLGLSQAVIQYDELTGVQLNALFWINSVAGVVLGLVVVAVAPLVAIFYGAPELLGITAGLAASYVFAGVAVQPSALLARRLSFRALAVRTTVGRLASTVAAVTAALLGAGYWSLVVQQVVFAAATCAMVWWAVDWRPSRPRRLGQAWPLVRFGAGFTVGEVLNTLSRTADNVLIGRFLGASQLGLYTRAYGLLMLPIRQLKTPLGSTVQPLLAAVRSEPDRYRRLYTSAVSGLCHLGMPALVLLAIPATPLVEVLLGRAWLAAAPIFQLLAVAGIVQLVSSTAGWIPVTMGLSGRYARMSLVAGLATTASFVAGLPWGVTGVAAAYAVGQVAMTPALFWYCTQGSPVRSGDVLAAMWRPLVVAAVTGLAATAPVLLGPDLPAPALLLAVWAAGGLAWGLLVATWPTARAELRLLLAGLRRR